MGLDSEEVLGNLLGVQLPLKCILLTSPHTRLGSAPREIKRVSCCNMRMVLVSLGLQCQMEGGETVYIATPLSML